MNKTALGTAFVLALANAGFGQSAAPAGNGPYAAPLAAAYSDLSNAAAKIVTDNSLQNAATVIYDAQTFSSLSSYQVAVEQLRLAMTKLCPVPTGGVERFSITLTADIGGAASGLAALLAAVTPTYLIQGQSVTFDNTALIAAFAHAAGANVIFPGYLPPAPQLQTVACGHQNDSSSLVDLWYAAVAQASQVATDAANTPDTNPAKKALQDKVTAFQKVADSFVAIDKGPSMLSKLLIVESLLRLIPDKSGVNVIDLRLDSAGVDSTTKTVLFWKSIKFNSTVMAHYTLLRLSKTGDMVDIRPVRTDSVIILSKIKKLDAFGSSSDPAGPVNGQSPCPTACGPAR